MTTWQRLGRVVAMAGILAVGVGLSPAHAGGAQPPGAGNRGGPPYNIVFLICDQETYRLFAGANFVLPARRALARRGVTFRNHYIASAMCTPSRAAFFSGQPPQVNGVFDQMEFSFVPNLSPDRPNIGSVLKGLGYRTAYFGKFELDGGLLSVKNTVNYRAALQPYGFDVFSSGGDIGSAPDSGYVNDAFIAGESVRWLRESAAPARRNGQPFLMVASFVNPHDIMYADANVPGQPPVQQAVSPRVIPPPPANEIYQQRWAFTLPPSLPEPLTGPGMPGALAEYHQGWSGWSGFIPPARKDMWGIFYNNYLNCIRDNDRQLQLIVNALDELDLWKDTVVVLTADHGEMAGAHGGLKGKGPFCYEANSHVPLVIAHPRGKAGASCAALTSHLDLLPTFVGLTGLAEARRTQRVPAAVKALPGRDFSALLAAPEQAASHAVRPGVLFNYVGISTVDGEFLLKQMKAVLPPGAPQPPLTSIRLNKRGFLAFVFDGRYKFARYYAPDAFNTPTTLNELRAANELQLFDLQNDPDEVRNLAVEPERNGALLLRMNALLNDLMAKEVGANDGRFLPEAVRPKPP